MSEELLDGFRIGSYQVLPREEKIVGPQATHHVEPKVMQVLVMLAGKPGQTLSRNDILDEVWSDTVVGDEVLSRAISLLRGYFQDEMIPQDVAVGNILVTEVLPNSPAQAAGVQSGDVILESWAAKST